MNREFDDALDYMREIVFSIGGFFDGYETRTYSVIGDEVFLDFDQSLIMEPSDSNVRSHFAKEEFISELKKIHIGNWKEEYIDPRVLDGTHWELEIRFDGDREPVRIIGNNAYPYNFRALLNLLGIAKKR